ncbi:MAG: F0F1 ATP synthase subunit delta [Alphaproteobacteria bacterium]|nr:F0F1 ATP synthase subunit delta [Alphaproteobacteria bacterium]MDX5368797.1 F0F1 ATP synthase subunit delta [Alphaproteobacteria bacterium]MDX5463531.1 F0F1 ATP synthase subunit delta [Alphaproteobacteria bacterium]
MSDGTKEITGVGGRYATALFDLAREDDRLDAVARDLDALAQMLDGSADLRRLVSSPVFSREDQAAGIQSVAEKAGFDDLTRRFLGLVAANRRLFALDRMIAGYRALLRAHRGEISADVVSATPLTEKQLDDLRAELKAAMGRDVQVDVSVDDSLLGGLIVKVGSRMIDSSIRTKLRNLQLAMKEAR